MTKIPNNRKNDWAEEIIRSTKEFNLIDLRG